MKAWIISDMHVPAMAELMGNWPVPSADICICAGDVSGDIDSSISFVLGSIAPHMPVVMTLGNHDYYGSSIDRAFEIVAKRLAGTQVHVLENAAVEINGLRFIGATLWTDYLVPWGGKEPELPIDDRLAMAAHVCLLNITDFREIRRSDERKPGETGLITIQELRYRHRQSRAYIESELAKPYAGRTLVLTHHAPSVRSIHPDYLGQPSNAAFASDLAAVISDGKPDYWVHGHVHHFLDYREADTRVLCNARGYAHERHVNGSMAGFVIQI